MEATTRARRGEERENKGAMQESRIQVRFEEGEFQSSEDMQEHMRQCGFHSTVQAVFEGPGKLPLTVT